MAGGRHFGDRRAPRRGGRRSPGAVPGRACASPRPPGPSVAQHGERDLRLPRLPARPSSPRVRAAVATAPRWPSRLPARSDVRASAASRRGRPAGPVGGTATRREHRCPPADRSARARRSLPSPGHLGAGTLHLRGRASGPRGQAVGPAPKRCPRHRAAVTTRRPRSRCSQARPGGRAGATTRRHPPRHLPVDPRSAAVAVAQPPPRPSHQAACPDEARGPTAQRGTNRGHRTATAAAAPPAGDRRAWSSPLPLELEQLLDPRDVHRDLTGRQPAHLLWRPAEVAGQQQVHAGAVGVEDVGEDLAVRGEP